MYRVDSDSLYLTSLGLVYTSQPIMSVKRYMESWTIFITAVLPAIFRSRVNEKLAKPKLCRQRSEMPYLLGIARIFVAGGVKLCRASKLLNVYSILAA